jgi:hypothetical protein
MNRARDATDQPRSDRGVFARLLDDGLQECPAPMRMQRLRERHDDAKFLV